MLDARPARPETSDATEILFNPLDPAFGADPYPSYAQLRELDPVHKSPFGIWVVSRYADCHALLRHPAVSSDQRNSTMFKTYVAQNPLTPAQREVVDGQPMLVRDPPDHTRLRRLASAAFTPRVVESMRPRVQQIVDELLDAVAAARHMDVVADVAYPVPVRVIGELLGVPIDDQPKLKEWSSVLVADLGLSLTATADPDSRRDTAAAFDDYFRHLIAKRRADPGSDLLSRLVVAEEHGDSLSEAELLTTCVLLLIAGHETTANLIGNGLLALLEHRDQLDRVLADPGLLPNAIEELLRYDSPVQLSVRIALEPIELSGRTIEAGDMVIVLLGSANRDPERFADPDSLDVGRTDNHHLAFGSGIHLCLGAPLARLEADVVLSTVLQRMPDLALADGDHSHRGGFVLRGLRALPVSW